MKKYFWITFLISGFVSAQETDTLAYDTVEIEPPVHYLGLYINGGLSFEASTPRNNFFSILGVGAQYDRWSLDFKRFDFQGTIQSFVVFPNTFELKYRYAGINLAYQLYNQDNLDLFVGISYNKGDMVWRNLEDGQDFLRDEFNLIKMGLRGEFAKFRYVKPHISIGYQKMSNLNISRLEENNFSGLFVAAGIRMGYFNQ
ncbi:hypothetical protein [Ekhidna sp.]|uniref:hypothetical protein n=1 Tax=Ekhidna sp. TaxID=2608089 RepID=UPI00329A53EE